MPTVVHSNLPPHAWQPDDQDEHSVDTAGWPL